MYYILYTPRTNLGLRITVFDLGREHDHFRGSIEGARGSKREQGGARRDEGSTGAQHRSTEEPELTAS